MNKRLIPHLGWPFIVTTTVIPVLLWLFMQPLSLRFNTTYLTLGSIGKLSGLIAVVLFCINVILATRLKFIEYIFGGLNKVYIAHHITGGLALCIVLLHPITLALQRATFSVREAALFLIPINNQIEIVFGILALWLFELLMIVTFYVKLPYRIWLFTHKFLGAVLILIGLHVILISSDTSQNILLKFYMLVLLFIALVAFVYRTLLPRIFVRRYLYKITNVSRLNSGVVRIFMKPKEQALQFKAGQFIFVSFLSEGFSKEWHPFSISSNEKDKEMSITVKSFGSYTDKLVNKAPKMVGTYVNIEGAYGGFSFRNFKAKRQIWIAGGIGITPFLGMIKDIPKQYKVDLYYTVKSKNELVDAQEIARLAEKSGGNFKFIPHYSDAKGLLTAEYIKKKSGDLNNAEILVCGPTGMMQAMKDQFKQAGVKKWNIHSEEFSIT